MKTFHESLAMREGLWQRGKIAVIDLSLLNPLPGNSAVDKSLAKGPAKAKVLPGVAATIADKKCQKSPIKGVRDLFLIAGRERGQEQEISDHLARTMIVVFH
jgi:hypothetical protein